VWIAWAFGSAFFAGAVAILAKIGMQSTSANLATALRTVVVVILAWSLVFVGNGLPELPSDNTLPMLFLVLSGLATGGSWLAYLHALRVGPVNPVVAIDDASIVLTVLLGIVLFGETANWGLKVIGVLAIVLGTYMIVQWRPRSEHPATTKQWLPLAVVAAVLASLTAILGKIGIEGIDVTLGTAIRTLVVLAMAWLVVAISGDLRQVRSLQRRDLWFIALSGLATGLSWLCFYQALQQGPISAVVPIDKLSLPMTVLFSYLILRERISRRGMIGLFVILLGTLATIPSGS